MTKTQATVFSLVLAAGVTSSVFFFKHLQKESETLVVDPDGETQPANVPDKPETKPPVTPPDPTAGTDPKPGSNADDIYNKPEKLMGALADLVRARDAEAFIAMAGDKAISAETRPALIELLENPAYAPPAKDPVMPLARLSDATRWSIQLEPVPVPASAASKPAPKPAAAAAPAAPPATAPGEPPALGGAAGQPAPATPAPATSASGKLPDRQIYVDLSETVVDRKKRYEITKVLVPPPLGSGMTGVLPPGADPITVAHHFSQAIMSSDFKTARALSDPEKITDEKIAALMIAIEEGDYELHRDRPLTQTLSRDTVSWIIARIRNDDAVSEFGLEMSKLDPDKGWLIDAITFDKVIQMTAAEAGAGNVAYAPFVKNPQGGDSLVVFFEFDSADLNPRAQKQVGSIARILKDNPARQININGHADALGLDDYNAQLSARRASAVKEALLGLGVSADQIVTKGFGETAPVSPNFKPDGSDNPSGRSQNRRTEVYLNF